MTIRPTSVIARRCSPMPRHSASSDRERRGAGASTGATGTYPPAGGLGFPVPRSKQLGAAGGESHRQVALAPRRPVR